MQRELLLALTVTACTQSAADTAEQDATAPTACPEDAIPIAEVQGRTQRSPVEGLTVEVCGIVTSSTAGAITLETPALGDDLDARTSEALSVELTDDFDVFVGEGVSVVGTVVEQGSSALDLPTTGLRALDVQDVGALPAGPDLLLGMSGLRVPDGAVDSNPTTFDPSTDALDFFESIEFMRVAVDGAVIVGGTDGGGELVVLADAARSAPRSRRGGLLAAADDMNPERLIVAAEGDVRMPAAHVGDRFDGRIEGVIGYSGGEYALTATAPLPPVLGAATPAERTTLTATRDEITAATYNVHNFALTDGVRIDAIATQIVERLGSPDVLAIQEVEDDDGTDTKTRSADETLAALTTSIVENGGPRYAAFDIPPSAEDADGGLPHANIRPAFLYRTDRMAFSARPSTTTTTTAASVTKTDSRAVVTPNPARIAPSDSVWQRSRKPLVAQLCFDGRSLTFVNVHFRSRLGDDALFGARQPPERPSAAERVAQADLVASFVRSIEALEPDAFVIVLGDFNDDPFSDAVGRLVSGAGLTNLLDAVPNEDRYTYNFRGNSHAFDQVLATPNAAMQAGADIVHTNADFAEAFRVSDHDPVVVRISVPRGPGCP